MSTLGSLIACKCPRCQQGQVYKHGAFSKDFKAMYTYCPKCNLRYELEIGFFWGAMYIGYALSVAISVILGVATFILGNNPDTWVYISVIVAGVLLASRFNFRYGRMILLYMFAPKFSSE
jgi:uncharacterized protein (DUF983 family)